MATIQERYEAACARLERAVSDLRDGDKSVSYDLAALRRERDNLAALLQAQSTAPRSTRTLLSMEDV